MKMIDIYWRWTREDELPLHVYATEVEVKNGFLILTDVDDNIHAYRLSDIHSYHIMLKAPQNCQ